MMAPIEASMMFFSKMFCVFLGDTRPASSIAKPVCIYDQLPLTLATEKMSSTGMGDIGFEVLILKSLKIQ